MTIPITVNKNQVCQRKVLTFMLENGNKITSSDALLILGLVHLRDVIYKLRKRGLVITTTRLSNTSDISCVYELKTDFQIVEV